MAKNKILNSLREVIYSIYDENGNERVKFKGVLSDTDISEGRLDLLKNICRLVLDTDIVCEYTKIYLKNRMFKMSHVHEIVNENIKASNDILRKNNKDEEYFEYVPEMSLVQVQNKIQYDQGKLEKLLGSDIFVDIIRHSRNNIEHYQIVVDNLIKKYKHIEDNRDKLTLNINNNVISKRYDGDFIKDYGNIIYTYLDSTRKLIENQLNSNDNFVGYFNYLLSSIYDDNEKVKRDRDLLNRILKGEVRDINIEIKITEDNIMDKLKDLDISNIDLDISLDDI